MDNTEEFEDLVKELDSFEQDAKSLQDRIARLMHDAREVSGLGAGPEGSGEGVPDIAES